MVKTLVEYIFDHETSKEKPLEVMVDLYDALKRERANHRKYKITRTDKSNV